MMPAASEMAEVLRTFCSFLSRNKIIEQVGHSNVSHACNMLTGKAKTWRYSVEPSMPLKFCSIYNPQLDKLIYPIIYSKLAHSEEMTAHHLLPPFTELVSTLEIREAESGALVHRWHIDLANKNKTSMSYQDGPLYHLQVGGHSPGGDRINDFKVKEPRWLHPPMDIVLLCETIIANFYEDQWNTIKNQQTWTECIHFSQQLCYEIYFNKISDSLTRRQSVLSNLWAASWGV
jgi:hypothetical protein